MNERLFGIYSLYDRVADVFRSVTVDTNDLTAKRNFAFAMQNSPELAFQAQDLELCRVGSFDSHSGAITPLSPVQIVCRGSEVVKHE